MQTFRRHGVRSRALGASVIEAAPKAGFTLAKSEVNANPLDTKTIRSASGPCRRHRSAPSGEPPNPNFDHAKYDALASPTVLAQIP